MTQPRFLSDEDIRGPIITAIRREEPALDLMTAYQAGLAGAGDAAILDYAWKEERLVISHDVSTMSVAARQRLVDGGGIRGLFLIPQHRLLREIIEELILIWSASEQEEWLDQILYLPL